VSDETCLDIGFDFVDCLDGEFWISNYVGKTVYLRMI
jgi:hypothetical protein